MKNRRMNILSKCIIALGIWSLGIQAVFPQNSYPTNSDAVLDGYSLRFKIPSTSGGWARGNHFYGPTGSTKWAGVGLYGVGTVQNRIYLAHGSSPHGSLLGMHILSTGNIGIGTINPQGKLEIKGGSGEQSQGQIHLVGNGETGPGDAYISFYEGSETNSKWSVGVKDHDNAFSISHGLTMDNAPKMIIKDVTGDVGIGTTTPDAKLTVKGDIHAQEVKVDLDGAVAPDYVFHKDYNLRPLKEVQEYIHENGHLPNIPSAVEMEENGLLLKEMNLKLLEKIEELTLYILELKEENKDQFKQLEKFKVELNHLKNSQK